jgi:hypothetical protein
MHAGLQWGNLRERDHLEDTGEDDMIILKWTDLAQYRDKWRVLENAVMNLRFS